MIWSVRNLLVSLIFTSYMLTKSLFHSVKLLFFLMNGLGLAGFFGLAQNWSKLMQHWQMVEALPIFHNSKNKKVYVRSIQFIASATLIMAFSKVLTKNYEMILKKNTWKTFVVIFLAEHLFYALLYSARSFNANLYREIVKDFVPCFTSNNDCIPLLMAIFTAFVCEYATFVWNFLDIFIMMISFGLSTHFKILNYELKLATDEVQFCIDPFIFI